VQRSGATPQQLAMLETIVETLRTGAAPRVALVKKVAGGA